jgi:non-ribosomal peptide synthetase component F
LRFFLRILRHGCAFVPLSKRDSPVEPGLNIGWLISEAENTFEICGHPIDIRQVHQTPEIKIEGLAYSLTTSGTTGNPKQVLVPHKAIVPNIIYFRCAFFSFKVIYQAKKIILFRDQFKICPEDVVFQSAPSTFDPFVVEVFTAFAAGAKLLMVPSSVKNQPELLFRSLTKRPCPTILQATPSLIKSLGTSRVQKLLGKRINKKM